MLRLDHLVFAAQTLGPGREWMADALGVAPSGGGAHPLMGTHNALWRLGTAYLEVIAIDPDAPSPDRPRWYGLDSDYVAAKLEDGPRLITWVARTDTLVADVAAAPRSPGMPLRVTRDALYWDLTVPDDGALIWEGAYPTLIQWPDDVRPPNETLPDTGLRLSAFKARGPDGFIDNLRKLGVAGIFDLTRPGPRPSITAHILRPDGQEAVFQS